VSTPHGDERRRTRHLRPEGAVISEVPQEVVDTAKAAFDARRPGTRVLDLVWDSRFDNLRRFEDRRYERQLRFGSPGCEVHIGVIRNDSLLELEVDVSPADDLEMELKHIAPELRLVMRGRLPVRFMGVRPGLVTLSLCATSEDSDFPASQTAWIRL
jgi:hypothetical protein